MLFFGCKPSLNWDYSDKYPELTTLADRADSEKSLLPYRDCTYYDNLIKVYREREHNRWILEGMRARNLKYDDLPRYDPFHLCK